MGTSLIGLLPQNTYSGLIKVGNNTALNTTLKTLSDGAGNDLPMQASTTGINFTGTVSGVASGVSGAIQFSNGSAFASDAANLFWDDTNDRLGVGTNNPQTAGHFRTSGSTRGVLSIVNANDSTNYGARVQLYNKQSGDPVVDGANGLALIYTDSTATSFLWNYNNGPMLFGTAGVERMRLNNNGGLIIKGSGSTSATTSLLVQNSAGTASLTIKDDRTSNFNGFIGGNNGILIGPQTHTNINPSEVCATSFYRRDSSGGFQTGFDLFTTAIQAYGSFGVGASPLASAILQADSTTKGFLPPRMTTTQKNAIASPAEGLQMYDSTAKSPAYYDGTNWGYTGGALQNAAGNSGTLNISFAAGNIVNLTLNATTTLAFSNAVIGTYIIQVTQGATGSNLLTYPASVKWAGGTAPTLTTTVGKTDILTFYYDGTFYYGNYSLNY